MIRKPAVAGRFYPSDPLQLTAWLEQYVAPASEQQKAYGVVVPHAGYVYSGPLAASTFASVTLPRRFIGLCPNHTGLGAPISLVAEGSWETPLGTVEIDQELANALLRTCDLAEANPLAHRDEHALEVQIPFLQHLLGNGFRFVPVAIRTEDYNTLVTLGHAMGRVVRQCSEPVLFISSSDMNHFEPAQQTLEKDQLAIDRILDLDSAGLFEVVNRERISMCGYGPTIAVIEAARQLGATGVRLIGHTHSGLISGENTSVVGYAGLVIH